MNMNNVNPPPINNALQPDIYNRLDAETIERTRVANNQLHMRLMLEERVINKYRHEAERIILQEKSRVAQELTRITRKLPAMGRMRGLEEQLFTTRSNTDPLPRATKRNKRKKKNYQNDKNDDLICQRCYIHHLPLKKMFYRKVTPPPQPTVFDSENGVTSEGNHAPEVNSIPVGSVSKQISDLPSRQNASASFKMVIPPIDTFKFLERDRCGRETDLNQVFTPRLMPNEMWKGVVKDVCSQHVKKDTIKTRPLRCAREFSRERTLGEKSDRISSVNKRVRGETQTLTRSPSTLARMGSFRRQSVTKTNKRNEPQAPSRSSSTLKKSE
ncbi:uncharacterized protein LOC131941774 [Physella acuta]|uniref:uncharacterized protein LOC131941774 n=1 Tax=Physella acuta TaxID=109671 RepID=UPI0027DD2046|nr:uncharacterized protein LOC131941774 [Physella acuta]